MLKKILLPLLCISMSFGLAACSGSESTESQEAATGEQTEQE